MRLSKSNPIHRGQPKRSLRNNPGESKKLKMIRAARLARDEPHRSEEDSVCSEDSLTAVLEESKIDHSFDETLQNLDCKNGSETTWNEEVRSEIESLGLSLHDSLVMALRDEATKMDAVMAADHVSSLEEEVRRLSRELTDRTEALEQLQLALQEKEEKIGTLELERDLYKADTSMLTRDLQKCMQKLKTAEATASKREATPRTRSTTTTSVSRRNQLDRPLLSSESWGSASNSTITSATISRSEASDEKPPPSFPVIEKPRLVLRNRKASANNGRSQAARSQSTCGGRGFQFFRGFPSRRSSSGPGEGEELVEVENPDMILQEQLQAMGRRMNIALETADELRRRLAMVSRYYEATISKMEDDMVYQLSASEDEKKLIVETLQSQMHEQEVVISDLRSRVMRPFN